MEAQFDHMTPNVIKSYDITDSPKPQITTHPTNDSSLSMKYEINRLQTFNDWRCPFIDKHTLAKNGFYYFGKDDHVRCAFCRVEIGQWVMGDDCQVDHQRWSSRCLFIRGYDVGNVPIDANTALPLRPVSQDTCGMYRTEVMMNSYPEQYNALGVGLNMKSEDMNIRQIGLTPHTGPKFRQYCTEESRIKTFKEWPKMMKQKPEQLAEAGFFYNGRGDQVLCFHCGGGLKDWEEKDDPWEQHARWFSKCTHIRLNKGEAFIEKVCNANPPMMSGEDITNLVKPSSITANGTVQENEIPTPSVEVPSTSSTESSLSNESTINSTPEKSTDETGQCEICYNDKWNVLFLPCKHALACKKCASALSKCPLCREQIQATLEIFPSFKH